MVVGGGGWWWVVVGVILNSHCHLLGIRKIIFLYVLVSFANYGGCITARTLCILYVVSSHVYKIFISMVICFMINFSLFFVSIFPT